MNFWSSLSTPSVLGFQACATPRFHSHTWQEFLLCIPPGSVIDHTLFSSLLLNQAIIF